MSQMILVSLLSLVGNLIHAKLAGEQREMAVRSKGRLSGILVDHKWDAPSSARTSHWPRKVAYYRNRLASPDDLRETLQINEGEVEVGLLGEFSTEDDLSYKLHTNASQAVSAAYVQIHDVSKFTPVFKKKKSKRNSSAGDADSLVTIDVDMMSNMSLKMSRKDVYTKPEFSEEELQCKPTFEPYTPWLASAQAKTVAGVVHRDWKHKCIDGGNDEDIFKQNMIPLQRGVARVSPGSCYGCWSYTSDKPMRFGSNRPLNVAHVSLQRDGMIAFDPHVHFDRPKESVASFRQVVMNAMRFFVLKINFVRHEYITGRKGMTKVKNFQVCRGIVKNLIAHSMDINDAYFEVYGDSVEFVIKGMTLEAELDYDFLLKIPPVPACVGDVGHLTVRATADIRMRFDSQTNEGSCSYDNMAVKILTVPGSRYPAWMVKMSARMLSSDSGAGFNLVPLIGASAIEEMCKQFRGWNSRSYQDKSRIPKTKDKDAQGRHTEFVNMQGKHPEVDIEAKIPMSIIIAGACGVVVEIALLVGLCCCCQFCGWKFHEKRKRKELEAKRWTDVASAAVTKEDLAQFKFCAATCPCDKCPCCTCCKRRRT